MAELGILHAEAGSLFFLISFLIGAGTVPTLIGILGDSASFASGYMLVGCLLALGALAAWFLDSLVKIDVVAEHCGNA